MYYRWTRGHKLTADALKLTSTECLEYYNDIERSILTVREMYNYDIERAENTKYDTHAGIYARMADIIREFSPDDIIKILTLEKMAADASAQDELTYKETIKKCKKECIQKTIPMDIWN